MTIEIRITKGQSFSRTLKTVKESRGARYNPSTQTWIVEEGSLITRVSLKQYPYEIVTSGQCPRYIRDQGCPLHGELCAPEYR